MILPTTFTVSVQFDGHNPVVYRLTDGIGNRVRSRLFAAMVTFRLHLLKLVP
jgi:hypothetical protein